MPSMLEHVVEQIGTTVLKYINGIRDDLSEKDLSEEYYFNHADIDKTSIFFNENINYICSKSSKAERRKPHL